MRNVEIARYAGVSVATVSRALNNSGYVKKETRDKISSAIEKIKSEKKIFNLDINYSMIRTIGIVIPDISNNFFGKVVEGIEKICFENHYIPIIFNSKENEEIEEVIIKRIKKVGVCGLIITPVTDRKNQSTYYNSLIESLRVPIVLLDRDLDLGNYEGVFIDNIAGTSEAIESLLKNGHEKIGIIAGPQNSKPGRERYMGFEKTMLENELEIKEKYVKFGDFKIESGYELTKDLLKLKERPTAIFISNNMMCYGALKAIEETNFQIGKDISLITFDDIEINNFGYGKISNISRKSLEMGELAIKLLLEKIDRRGCQNYSSRKIVLKPELILRGSEKINL